MLLVPRIERSVRMNRELSPCTYCCRVADPKNCDNKKCVPWQKWFVKRWEQTRQMFRTPLEKATTRPAGIPLGGHRYVHPHRVRAYQQNGPCGQCKLPADLCHTPCPAKRHWEAEKEVSHELEG